MEPSAQPHEDSHTEGTRELTGEAILQRDEWDRVREDRKATARNILTWAGGRLITVAPPDWARLTLDAKLAADSRYYTFTAMGQDGAVHPLEIPSEVYRAFPDLRDTLFEYDWGTWYSLRIELDPPDSVKGTYNYDVDPMWEPPLPFHTNVDELARYSRSAVNVPRWLAAQLAPPGQTLPTVPPGTVEQITQRSADVGLQVRLAVPAGWTWTQVHFREIGGTFETSALVQDVTGRMSTWSPPPAVGERFSDLRATMRGRPAVWYRAQLDLFYSGEEKLRFFGPDQPEWLNPPGPDAYQEELRRAAETPEVTLPDWVTEKLG